MLRHLLFGMLVAFGPAAHAREQSTACAAASRELPKPDADGFITLFNGKDLTGWQGLADYWSVKDGAIGGHQA
ncbi:MAG: hypothetical protein ACLPL5_13145, partial [Stellaceae bacterium]